MAGEEIEAAAQKRDAPAEGAGGTLPVVGIGASAGGIQALQTFFDALPQEAGAAFVVVVHLDPKSHSELSRILAVHTQMPVVQVDKAEALQANKVYVIPPDRRLVLMDHEISCAEFDEPRGRRAAIDLFFRSLADHGAGFAVVLTGAGSDGAIGVRAVKESGGIILVQDPSEAEYPSMPRNAIATGVADFVLPVHDLAVQLGELLRAREKVSISETAEDEEELVRRILTHLRIRTGHDFTRYKRTTVLRRIARRMQVKRTAGLNEYYGILSNSAEEPQALLGDLLISVTTFFRDPEAFEALKKQVLPALFEGKDPSEAIRVWVPGCATGEEAYSIAMLLLEEAARHDVRPGLQVFASDLDERALLIAREGRFPATIGTDVSEDRLHRFFTREGEGFYVRRELRDLVLFASHDLLKDPPFSRIDLISCRNVLIYLDRELQEQVCSTFSYALNPGGFLFLGTSETADNPPGLFRVIDRGARIYQSTVRAGERPRLLPRLLASVGGREIALAQEPQYSAAMVGREAALHRQAIEALAPPSILVDEAHA
jgi:two-component system CheB/CheR fusion protein